MNGLERLIEIRKLSSQQGGNWIITDVFRLLRKDDLWISAYDKVSRSKGALTLGVDENSADGFSMKILKAIKEEVTSENYSFNPVREVHIPKANGKKRNLGVPSFYDKIVQEVIRMILEAIYEPIFIDESFGFRTNKGPHNALKHIENSFRWCTYVIEGDIKDAYPSINHEILIKLIERKIKDSRFINLIRRLLKAGILKDSGVVYSPIGTPQGSVVSPMLANIYFHELDKFVKEKSIVIMRCADNRRNPEYKNISAKISRRVNKLRSLTCKKSSDYKDVRNEVILLSKQRRNIPSQMTKGIKVHYVRYADDWVIGVEGSYELTRNLLDEVRVFLHKELNLALSTNKTKITCFHRGVIKFLGYDIFIPRCRPLSKVNGVTRRGNCEIRFEPQMDKILSALASRGYLKKLVNEYRPISKAGYTILEDHIIVLHFGSVWLGLYNYFSGVTNRSRLLYLQYLLQTSCAMTLGHRHRISSSRIFKKYGNELRVRAENTDSSLGMLEKNKSKIISFPVLDIGKLETRKWRIATNFKDPFTLKANTRSKSNLYKGCLICRSTQDIEMHHVKHVRKRGITYNGFLSQMGLINRKQIPVCRECHNKIHKGLYDDIALKNL